MHNSKSRDPEIRYAQKGNQYCFGLKTHIGVYVASGLLDTLVTVAENMQGENQTCISLHGEDHQVYDNSGYLAVSKRKGNKDIFMNLYDFYRLSALTAAFITASGCSVIIKDPIYHSVTRNTKVEKLNNETRGYQIGWLAQALLEPQVRNVVAQKLAKSAPIIETSGGFRIADAADVSLTAQMMTDLAVGQISSSAGSNIGSAFFIGATALSLLSGDGSLQKTNVVLLPAQLNDKLLDSADLANSAAQKLILKRYAKAADKFGYSFTCEYSCDAFPSLYRMQRKAETDTSQFIYAADDVAIYFSDFEIVAPEKTQLIDSLATGFNVAWRTHYNNDAGIYILQNPKLNEENKINITYVDNKPSNWSVHGDGRFFKTDFGHTFLRDVYKTPYMLFGAANSYPQIAFYNGTVYSYIFNDIPNAFNRVVLPFSNID